MDEEMEEEEMVREEDSLKCLSGTSLQNASTGQKNCGSLCLQITIKSLNVTTHNWRHNLFCHSV